jgi:predicted component of type VI protein secretion system
MTKHTVAVFRGDSLVNVIELTGQDVRIGRSPDNELCLRDDGKAVSRFHAELRPDASGYVVFDLNSQNGTWVDGERVTRSPLASGRDIVIGPYRLVVREGEFREGELPPMVVAPGTPTLRLSSSNQAAVSAVSTQPVAPRLAKTEPARPAAAAARRVTGPQASANARNALIVGAVAALLAIAAIVAWMARGSTVPSTAGATPPPAATALAPAADPAPQPLPVTTASASDPAPPDPVPQTPLAAPAADTGRQVRATLPIAPAAGDPPARPRPQPKKADPVDPNALPRLDGESEADWQARNTQAAADYQRALDRLAQRNWIDAVKAWTALAERYPAYRDTAVKLDEARAGLREAARAALDAGNDLLATDMPAALQQFERAAEYGSAEAADLVTRTRDRMRVEGVSAFKSAKQYDAANRTAEAIAFYERAVRYLASGDPDRQYAEDRLRRLRQ